MKKKIIILSFLILIINACNKEAEPINYGQDECEFCKMIVMDKRYGAELVTDKAKIFKFDSIECLIGYLQNKNITKENYSSVWVGNYANPGSLIDAEKATYLKNDEIRSPMGLNVLAVETKERYDKVYEQFGGKQLKWNDLFALVKEM